MHGKCMLASSHIPRASLRVHACHGPWHGHMNHGIAISSNEFNCLGTPVLCVSCPMQRQQSPSTACSKNALGFRVGCQLSLSASFVLAASGSLLSIFLHLLISEKTAVCSSCSELSHFSHRRSPTTPSQPGSRPVALMEPGNDAFYQPTIQQGSCFDAAQYSFFGDLNSGLAGALEVWLTSTSLACSCWCGCAHENMIRDHA